LSKIEKGNFWFESRNRLLIWALRRYFNTAANFLEIGCGTGFALSALRQEFPRMAFAGSEIFVEGLAYAKARAPDVRFFQMDARHIPFENEFDVVGAFDMLEHVEEDTIVLREMFRAANRGGGILLTVPQHPFLWSSADDHGRHKRRYTRRDMTKKVTRAGFQILRVTSFVSLLLPFMALVRVGRCGPHVKADPFAEFKIGGFINDSLNYAMSLERLLIEWGFSLPLGGSLLVAARKP
ncbi:MAG: class I SAM-dependent methyltransferase, partial [Candidatus Lindowbacteria bacterium]|nr:class I SAM-dependent methyltransferase [Candidatus Lindowbacteria bacterium]